MTYIPVWPAVSALFCKLIVFTNICIHRCHYNKNDLLTQSVSHWLSEWPFLENFQMFVNILNFRKNFNFNFVIFLIVGFFPSDFRVLGRQWLHYWQLRTWIYDNIRYLTINCDTGQHSQFSRCLNTNSLFPQCCQYLHEMHHYPEILVVHPPPSNILWQNFDSLPVRIISMKLPALPPHHPTKIMPWAQETGDWIRFFLFCGAGCSALFWKFKGALFIIHPRPSEGGYLSHTEIKITFSQFREKEKKIIWSSFVWLRNILNPIPVISCCSAPHLLRSPRRKISNIERNIGKYCISCDI